MALDPDLVQLSAQGKWYQAIRKWVERKAPINEREAAAACASLVPWHIPHRRRSSAYVTAQEVIRSYTRHGRFVIDQDGTVTVDKQKRKRHLTDVELQQITETMLAELQASGFLTRRVVVQKGGIGASHAHHLLIRLMRNGVLVKKKRGVYIDARKA